MLVNMHLISLDAMPLLQREQCVGGEANGTEPTFQDKVACIQKQMRLQQGLTSADLIDTALTDLKLQEKAAGKNLTQQIGIILEAYTFPELPQMQS